MERKHETPARKLSLIEVKQNDLLIERLEELLVEAKTGELQGLFYVCSWQGDYVSYGWNSRGVSRSILGAAELMKSDMAQRLLDDEYE